MDSKEYDEGGHKEPKDHSLRSVEIDFILGLPSLKKNHKMAHPYQQTLLKGSTKTAFSENNRQNQASGVYHRLWNYDWNDWSDEIKIKLLHAHHRYVWWQRRTSTFYLLSNMWVIDVLEMSCCQWSSSTI